MRHMEQLPTTGKELALMRVAADVRQGELAARIGVLSSTVSRWETSRRVTAKAAQRYVTALATFATSERPADGQDAA